MNREQRRAQRARSAPAPMADPELALYLQRYRLKHVNYGLLAIWFGGLLFAWIQPVWWQIALAMAGSLLLAHWWATALIKDVGDTHREFEAKRGPQSVSAGVGGFTTTTGVAGSAGRPN